MEDFYCFSCGKRKSIEVRSNTKVGRFKSANRCIPCDERAKKRTIQSNRNPEELIGYKRLRVKHLRTAMDKLSKKNYKTDITYNHFKERYDI